MEVDVRPGLAELAPAWDALLDGSPRPTPFLSSWWLEATAAGRPILALAFEGDRLIGGLPLTVDCKRGVSRVRIIGAGNPHDLDVIAARGREDDVSEAVVAWLTRPGNRLVDLEGLAPDGLLVRHLPPGTQVSKLEAAPWFDVPADFESYLASRRKKLRQEIRRIVRRFEEAGITYEVVDTTDSDRAMDTLERLHRRRWRGTSPFLDSVRRFESAVTAGIARGELCFHEVLADGRVIASLVTIERWGTCFFHQMGRDPDRRWSGSGTFLKARAIERACRLGFHKVDLCYGDPASKLAWADDRRPVVRARFAHGRVGRLESRVLAALRPGVNAFRKARIRARRRRYSAE